MAYQPKSHRKFVATSMAAAMVATAAAPAAMAAEQAETSEATITFSDFGENHRAATEVFKLVEEGIIQGFPDGTFRPDASITRGAAALMLARGLGLVDADGVALEESDAEGFDDVSSADRVYDATRLLKEEDIIGGYADGTFRSDHTITRAEMAIILANAFDLERTSEEFSFTDRGAASQEAVQALYDNGITQGTAQEMIFGSDNEIIRSDFSVQLYRAMGFEEDEEAPAALNVQSVVSVNSTTMEVTFEGELTEEDLEDMTFMFDPELEVTNVALKDAEVEAADEHMTTTVVLTTAEQEAGVTYQLTGVNGVALETPVTVDVVELEVVSVSAITLNDVTTVTADVLGTDEDTEVVVEIYANGDLDEDPAVTEEVDVEDDAIEVEIEGLPVGEHIARVVATQDEEEVYADVEFEITEMQRIAVQAIVDLSETGVELELSPLFGDVLDATVTVVDPDGNEIAVDATDLDEGETVAIFDFVDELDEIAEGIWTVNGVEYDTAALAAVEAVNDATDQIELLAALQSGYFENVDEDNIVAYWDAHQADSPYETVVEVQKMIDEANEDGTEADAVKAVADAETHAQLLTALDSAFFERVNNDWVSTYFTALSGITTSNDAEDVQDIIDTQNYNLANSDVGDALATLSTSDLNAAKSIVETYVAEDEEDASTTPKQDLLDDIEIHFAVIAVNNARTNNALDARLAELADVVNDDTVLDYDTVSSEILGEYREAIADESVTNKNSASDIQNIITGENDAAEQRAYDLDGDSSKAEIEKALRQLGSLYEAFDFATVDANFLEEIAVQIDTGSASTPAAVQTAVLDAYLVVVNAFVGTTEEDDVLEALVALDKATDDFDYDTVSEVYWEEIRDAIVADASNLDATQIQNKVVDVYLDEVNAFNGDTTETEVLNALRALGSATGEFDYDTVNENLWEEIRDAIEAAGPLTASEIQDEVNDIVLIVALNEAETASEVRSALTSIALYVDLTTNAGFEAFVDELNSSDRTLVSGLFMDDDIFDGGLVAGTRNSTDEEFGKYTSLSDVNTDLNEIITAIQTLTSDLNAVFHDGTDPLSPSNSAVRTELEKLTDANYTAFDELTATEKVEVASAFIDGFPVDDDDEFRENGYTYFSQYLNAIDAAIAAQ